jgi:hypothetical protein
MVHRSTFGVPKVDLSGKTFGRLYVHFQYDPKLRRHGKAGIHWEIYWNCNCSCGTTNVIVSGAHLRRGAIKSCGCLQKENAHTLFTKHGMSRTPEYNAYTGAINRCAHDEDYRGRGIEFKFTSFEQFFSELGPRPVGKTLDRKDNNGHYEPGNVQWATPKEQSNNTRRKRIENFSDEELRAEIRRREWNLSPSLPKK